MSSDYELSEMYNRFMDLITVGVVTELSEDCRKARIKYKGHETPFMILARNRSGEDEEIWLPSIGEMVVAIAPEGKMESAIIIASIPKEEAKEHKDNYIKKFKDGTEIKYNKKDSEFTLKMPEKGKCSIKIDKTEFKMDNTNIEIIADNIKLTANTDTIIDMKSKATINANTVIIESATTVDINGKSAINLNGNDGNVVTTMCACSFTGALHPLGSARVKAGLV